MVSAMSGQTSLCRLPPSPPKAVVPGAKPAPAENLDTYPVPLQLRLSNSNEIKGGSKKGTSSGVLGNGMDVIKLTKGGKKLPRRIAISNDNRHILVTTARGNSSVRNILKRNKHSSKIDTDVGAKMIDISTVDRIVRGPITKKFELSKQKSGTARPSKVPVSEESTSLSIFYRTPPGSSNAMEELQSSGCSCWCSIDLMIMNHNDYEVLAQTLEGLVNQYRIYRSCTQRSVLLLQHYWMETGKELGDLIFPSEWATLCIDHLSVPLKKSKLASIFRKYCRALKIKPESGINISRAVGLLETTRAQVHQLSNDSGSDPCDELWNLITEYKIEETSLTSTASDAILDPKFSLSLDREIDIYSDVGDDFSIKTTDSNKFENLENATPNDNVVVAEESITAAEFLHFLHNEQKETSTTLGQVRELFERLNSQTSGSRIDVDGYSTKSVSNQLPPSRDFITKSVFWNYILSDCNDIFDPVCGKPGYDDMSQPLSSYWINSSHDTFLKKAAPKISSSKGSTDPSDDTFNEPLDLMQYTTALERGCRCLDLDVWDGEGKQYGEPVVRFGVPSHKSKEITSDIANLKQGLLFQDILRAVNYFLLSNPSSTPIIFMVENHCSLKVQEKMALYTETILGSSDKLFIPMDDPLNIEDETLPSPEALRGKVVIKCKRPVEIKEGATVIFDDYDDENDIDPFSKSLKDVEDIMEEREDDGEFEGYVVGFDTVGSIISEAPHAVEKSPEELVEIAEREATEAKSAADKDEMKAFKANVQANRAEEFAVKMLMKAGLTSQQAEEWKEEPNPDTFHDDATYNLNNRQKSETIRITMASSTIEEVIEEDILDDESKIAEDINALIHNDSTAEEQTVVRKTETTTLDKALDSVERSVSKLIGNFFQSDKGLDSCNSGKLEYRQTFDSVDETTASFAHKGDRDSPASSTDVDDDIYLTWDDNENINDGLRASGSSNDASEATHNTSNRSGSCDQDIVETASSSSSTANDVMSLMSEDSFDKINFRHGNMTRKINIVPGEGMEMELTNSGAKSEEGIEVQHFYSNSVDQARAEFSEADALVLQAAGKMANTKGNLRKCRNEATAAEEALSRAQQRMFENGEASNRAASEARASQEHAEIARQRVNTVKELLDKCCDQAATAENVGATASSEAKISKQRAMEAEARAKRAQATAASDQEKSDAETLKEEELESAAAKLQRKSSECTHSAKNAKQKRDIAIANLKRVDEQIRKIESSEQFKLEKKEEERGKTSESETSQDMTGRFLKKHKLKLKEREHYSQKVEETTNNFRMAEEERRSSQKAFDEAAHKAKIQGKKAANARSQADQSVAVAEQLTEYAEEERDAAEMRQIASERADSSVQKFEAHRSSVEAQLVEAERAADEALDAALVSRAKADQLAKQAETSKDLTKFETRLAKKQDQLTKAEKEYQDAIKDKEVADLRALDCKRRLESNADVYYRAKIEASAEVHRANAKRQMNQNAVFAYRRHKRLHQVAVHAREKAIQSRALAADKASAIRHAKDYRYKKSMVKPISLKLAEMTLLHSTKFKYWAKSLALPFDHMHSISEGRMVKMVQNNDDVELMQWREFNKNHMTRIFPSRHETLRKSSKNFNPVLPWSLGCQSVAINQQICDAFLLVNDGRFRVNGSSGYVLKPDFMTELKGEAVTNQRKSFGDRPMTFNIKVLSGYNLPKLKKKYAARCMSPRIRLSLYDGGLTPPVVHITTAKQNGLTPVWSEKIGKTLHVKEPSVAILMISVWDYSGENREEFIAAAALPVSCMREGYRSVPLFDSNNMRAGSHSFSSLLVKVSEGQE